MTGVRQRLSGLSERWKSLRPTTRRVLTLGAVFVLGGLLFMVGMPDRKPRTLGYRMTANRYRLLQQLQQRFCNLS